MKPLSKKFALILYIPLMGPSLLLFVFAFMQEPINWLFIGIGIVLLLLNALMLMVVYKWLVRMANEPVEGDYGGEEV